MFAALILAPLLVFRGNAALLEDVYRSYLDMPASTKATPSNARSVATRLASFLHRAGYALSGAGYDRFHSAGPLFSYAAGVELLPMVLLLLPLSREESRA